MTQRASAIPILLDKMILSGELKLLTGMHIGAGKEFSAIGAVDLTVVRDPLSRKPIVPGSSLKGKLRSLLVRSRLAPGETMPRTPSKDPEPIRRSFGCSEPVVSARLQFCDAFLTKDSYAELAAKDLDLFLTEIKFENTINRYTAVANPRQIERVPAGSVFSLKIVYNLEVISEAKEDLSGLIEGLQILQFDYLGGHGSRGYGRIKFDNLQLERKGLRKLDQRETDQIESLLKELNDELSKVSDHALLSV
ncbi:MAG: type III-A CRISPR-associated RAMP protein Csm3 [Cyanobacteria bacterium NC_groundwater_1444_Ag_S-0.65um_54_12]|nr:type III-A CRISPR-associated RAMP protein Csm3 [Cyanobacteria bacterium NC_groundwater_1444_Ag_S-0.65um_54_12]